jgi:hypothetical protein
MISLKESVDVELINNIAMSWNSLFFVRVGHAGDCGPYLTNAKSWLCQSVACNEDVERASECRE